MENERIEANEPVCLNCDDEGCDYCCPSDTLQRQYDIFEHCEYPW